MQTAKSRRACCLSVAWQTAILLACGLLAGPPGAFAQPATPVPTISPSPSSLSFTAPQSGPNPADQTFALTNTGEPLSFLDFTITDNASWLTATPLTGTLATAASATITVAVDVTGLAAGLHSATITISDPDAGNDPQSVTVTLGIDQPAISLSPASLSFSGVQGGAEPSSQTFSVANTGPAVTTLNYAITDNAAWLTLAPTAGSLASGASATTTASASLAGLPAGTYSATVTVSDPAAANNPQTLAVTLVVVPPPFIALTPSSFSLFAAQGGLNPPSQTLNVSNAGGVTLNFTATDDALWLSVAPGSGSAAPGGSQAVSLSLDITGLAQGTYTALITISDSAASNSPQTAVVTLAVGPPTPVIWLAPASLSFSANIGGPDPSSQVLTITNGGPAGTTMNFTVSDDAPWLVASLASGSLVSGATATISLSVSISGLASGAYPAAITVSDPSAFNSPQSVPVALVVSLPPVQVTAVSPPRTLVPADLEITLTGSGFTAGGQTLTGVALVRNGAPDIQAQGLGVASDSVATATFALGSDTPGGWRAVQVVRSDGVTGILVNAIYLRRFEILSVVPDELARTGEFQMGFQTLGLGPFEDVPMTFSLVGPDGTAWPMTLVRRVWDFLVWDVDLVGAAFGTYRLDFVVDGASGALPGAVEVVPFVLADQNRFPPTPSWAFLTGGGVSLAVAFAAVEAADPPTFELVRSEGGGIRAVSVTPTPILGARVLIVRFEWEPTDPSLSGTYDLLVTQGSQVASVPGALTISGLTVEGVSPNPIPNGPNGAEIGGEIFEVHGRGFQPGAVVRLEWVENPAGPVSASPPVRLLPEAWTDTRLTVRKFARLEPGFYDVVVVNPMGDWARLPHVPVGDLYDVSLHVYLPWRFRPAGKNMCVVRIRNQGSFPVPERALNVEGKNLRVAGDPPASVGPIRPGRTVFVVLVVQAFRRDEIPEEDWADGFQARASLTVSLGAAPDALLAQADAAQADLSAAVDRMEDLARQEQAGVTLAESEVRLATAGLVEAVHDQARPLMEAAGVAQFREPAVADRLLSEATTVESAASRLEVARPALAKYAGSLDPAVTAVRRLAAATRSASQKNWAGAIDGAWAYGYNLTQAASYLILEAPGSNAILEAKEEANSLAGFLDPDWHTSTGSDTWIVGSKDPNSKVSANPGAAVRAGERIEYMIAFENQVPEDPNASLPAPALEIVIEDVLDPNLDPTSVEFEGSSHPNALASASVDAASGKIRWHFLDINLPPNVNPPEGEGFVLFSVLPRAGTPSGTVIRNAATITFDPQEGGPALSTSTVSVVLDTEPPRVTEAAILERAAGAVRMRLNAQDDHSGIRHVAVFGRENDTGLWAQYGQVGLSSPAEFEGRVDDPSRAEFHVVAIDLAGNESTAVRATEGERVATLSGEGDAGGGCAAGGQGRAGPPVALSVALAMGAVAWILTCRPR